MYSRALSHYRELATRLDEAEETEVALRMAEFRAFDEEVAELQALRLAEIQALTLRANCPTVRQCD
jgi:hypothetical protein